jgi:hypothetical protein
VGRHGRASGGALATDSVELSPDSIEFSRPVRPPNAYCYLDTLTDSDKSLVKAATGWDIDADPSGNTASPEAKQFVGRLNLDRAAGVLKGDIDQAYISKLIQENLSPQPDQAAVPLSVLYEAQRYLPKHRASLGRCIVCITRSAVRSRTASQQAVGATPGRPQPRRSPTSAAPL